MITSTANAKVKRLTSLMKKRKARDMERLFLTEGLRMFREAPVGSLKEVYVSESFYKKERRTVEQILADSRVRSEVLSDTVYDYVSDTKTPQGILCVAEQPAYLPEVVAGGSCPHIIVLEHLQDPGNLGTLLRTAEAAGVTGVIMDRECVDLFNPKTIRSTMGSVYRMPFCHVEDPVKTVDSLKQRGIRVYAAHLESTRDYDREDYRDPCAFLIGNEGNGLTEKLAGTADAYVRIPMAGQVESLNAAVAASVLMFEVSRQRRRK